ncbi:hypothetical protein MPER_11196 [Moniliophthora perniciosa FA553]|nr:hypothetical protein MPER_11196 [Moniliophthora perniciosa FA553]
MSAPLEKLSSNKTFEGDLAKYKFKSAALGGLSANFNLFLPPNASLTNKVPVLIYLAGLTCTEDNGAQKGSFLGPASSQGIAILFPDTSPRGANIAGEDDDWDFGTGAGFYLNATNPKYSNHYNMYTHVTLELPQVLEAAGLPIEGKEKYDATELIRKSGGKERVHILVDYGTADHFYKQCQFLPDNFLKAAREAGMMNCIFR